MKENRMQKRIFQARKRGDTTTVHIFESVPIRRRQNRLIGRLDHIQIRDMRKLCAFLCPSIEVDLYVTAIRGYLGIWDGISLRATRDLAVPVVQSSELVRWATDQAKLMGSPITDPELLFEIADFVNACGGDVGDLPIASGVNGWLNFSQIAEWQNVPDEILLISDSSDMSALAANAILVIKG